MVGDLIDLDFATTTLDNPVALRWIADAVTKEEFDALVNITTALKAGQSTVVWQDATGAACLLRHFVLTALNEQYQARVLLRRLGQTITEKGWRHTGRELVEFAFFLPNNHLKTIYGSNDELPLWRRIKRPFDFAWRGIRRIVRAAR